MDDETAAALAEFVKIMARGDEIMRDFNEALERGDPCPR